MLDKANEDLQVREADATAKAAVRSTALEAKTQKEGKLVADQAAMKETKEAIPIAKEKIRTTKKVWYTKYDGYKAAQKRVSSIEDKIETLKTSIAGHDDENTREAMLNSVYSKLLHKHGIAQETGEQPTQNEVVELD